MIRANRPAKLACLALAAVVFAESASPGVAAEEASQSDRPNVLWLVCEDISPYLGCYGIKEAKTPNLDRLAREGLRFTRAYANAPVCAVARSTLLTGMYSPTLGTHQMRARTQLPAEIPAYPKIFREAGYYCSNNNKKDYNSNFEADASLWDESSNTATWKNRKAGQPFFAVFNIGVTHEAQLDEAAIAGYVRRGQIPQSPRVSPASIKLPPYHPDLPEIRQDWARFHDLITLMDAMAGQRLQELEEAGVAENTIVCFFADNGGMLARSKRYIYNVGSQVPLIIRIPQRWRDWAPAPPGSTVDGLVSFVDMPKTMLALAGLPIPSLMQGRVFLGPKAQPASDLVHIYRDRMAERPDFSRAVTDGRYYYIRHFMPHRPPGRDSRYGNTVQANWRAWEEYFAAGKCNPIQSQFYQPKPVVELFDTETDPWHVTNLANQPAQRERLARFEQALDNWMVEAVDAGLLPEPLVYELVGPGKPHKTIFEYTHSAGFPVRQVLEAAKVSSRGEPAGLTTCLEFMADEHPAIRHWGAYGVFLTRSQQEPAQTALKKMILEDAFAANRVMAAQALAWCGDKTLAFETIKREANQTEIGYVFQQALNAFQYGHLDDRLTLEDWRAFKAKPASRTPGIDRMGFEYAMRIIEDALTLYPARRQVD